MPIFSNPFSHLGIDVRQLERDDLTRIVLANEGEIDDPDRSRLHEVCERRRDLAPELVSGKGNDHVVHWSKFAHGNLLLVRPEPSP